MLYKCFLYTVAFLLTYWGVRLSRGKAKKAKTAQGALGWQMAAATLIIVALIIVVSTAFSGGGPAAAQE